MNMLLGLSRLNIESVIPAKAGIHAARQREA